MSYLAVKKHGVIITWWRGISAADAPTSINNVEPDLYQDYLDGHITFEESQEEPTLGPLDYVSSMDADIARFGELSAKEITRQLHDLENRIRALESAGHADLTSLRRKFVMFASGKVFVRGSKQSGDAAVISGGGAMTAAGTKATSGDSAISGGGNIVCTGVKYEP